MAPLLFHNQMSDELDNELQQAEALGVIPISPMDEAFDEIINTEMGLIKWVVTDNEQLLVIPHGVDGIEISHAVINRGEPVYAAGEATIAGYHNNYWGLTISNRSGHYLPTSASLDIGLAFFAQHGIQFREEGIERVADE